jgi:hypothetical protein
MASLLLLLNRHAPARAIALAILIGSGMSVNAQVLLKPAAEGETVNLLPSDAAILEAGDPRKDLPCTITPRKPELGFDLKFHGGYEVTLPLREVAGDGGLLTVVLRAFPDGDPAQTSYFVHHIRVPSVDEDAKGEALLNGGLDLGPGKYHVDWLMRDHLERVCSSSWDMEATTPAKDKPGFLFMQPNQIAQSQPEPFVNDDLTPPKPQSAGLNVKLLVNFAPQNSSSASLQRTDTEALVSILKSIQRDARVGRVSLVAFNISQEQILYRQDPQETIDFPALGKALQVMKLGTVNVAKLSDKNSETDFLQQLIEAEVGRATLPDAVIFAGPKAMLNADVPQSELRRIGDVECPVFYMNYNLNPQAVPWKDSISHAIKAFKGTEYTISRPKDLWQTTSEMVGHIVRSKRSHPVAVAGRTVPGGTE